MAKATDFQLPTGAKGNILNWKDWSGLILGGLALIVSFATAQNLASWLGGKAKFIDTNIEKPYSEPKSLGTSDSYL